LGRVIWTKMSHGIPMDSNGSGLGDFSPVWHHSLDIFFWSMLSYEKNVSGQAEPNTLFLSFHSCNLSNGMVKSEDPQTRLFVCQCLPYWTAKYNIFCEANTICPRPACDELQCVPPLPSPNPHWEKPPAYVRWREMGWNGFVLAIYPLRQTQVACFPPTHSRTRGKPT
jgi:hypothetical protein